MCRAARCSRSQICSVKVPGAVPTPLREPGSNPSAPTTQRSCPSAWSCSDGLQGSTAPLKDPRGVQMCTGNANQGTALQKEAGESCPKTQQLSEGSLGCWGPAAGWQRGTAGCGCGAGGARGGCSPGSRGCVRLHLGTALVWESGRGSGSVSQRPSFLGCWGEVEGQQ